MALSAWQATIVNESGDVIPSAQIQVIDDATGLNADIFANSGGTPAANPFTATAGGFAQFYANAGTYRVIASDSGTGFSETWEDQRLGDAQARDTGTGSDQVPTNGDLPTFGGAASGDVPTNASLSAAVCGTATFSSDVYTFTPSGTGFRPLQAGMYLSFKLPSGSANTTTTPDINYNGSTYVIKWIDGSALVASDLTETYNKQPILFYFDGTNMLVASDISGSNWSRCADGKVHFVIAVTEEIPNDNTMTFSVSFPFNTANINYVVSGDWEGGPPGAYGTFLYSSNKTVSGCDMSYRRLDEATFGGIGVDRTSRFNVSGRWY